MLWQDRGFRIYCLCLFAMYLGLGFYGTLWVSDEFDQERAYFYAFFAVPLAFLYFVRLWFQTRWWQSSPSSFWLCTAILGLSFAWGNLLILNGISGQKRAVVNITMDGDKYALTYQRGGFGWLYKPRW